MQVRIKLFTSAELHHRTNEIKSFLLKHKFPFEEIDIQRNSDAAAKLLNLVGEKCLDSQLPGILYGDSWISGHSEHLYETIWQFWADEILRSRQRASRTGPRKVGAINEPDTSTKKRPPFLDEPTPSTTSNTTGTSSAEEMMIISLPDGTEATIGDLTRLLLSVTNHQVQISSGRPYYYFRGQYGMSVWRQLILGQGTPDEEVVRFAGKLADHGIIHNYTPEVDDFRQAFLVMKPLREPRVLNTFVTWPRSRDFKQKHDPMDVILDLSRLMDGIFIEASEKHHLLESFQQFEVKVCELQVVSYPSGSAEKATFALNLFNLIIRHAMIVATPRGWSWPKCLEELPSFMEKFGYDVGGKWVSLGYLQDQLFGTTDTEDAVLASHHTRRFKTWRCRGEKPDNSGQYYSSRVIQTDTRLLFALTWGVKSSPTVNTVYPNRLKEGLRAAAETYCQQNVKVSQEKVTIPMLLSWFRKDFASTNAPQVLKEIDRYLTAEQRRQIEHMKQAGRLKVVFGREFSWDCGYEYPELWSLDHDAQVPLTVIETKREERPSLQGQHDIEVSARELVPTAPLQRSETTRSLRSFLPIGRWMLRQPSVGDARMMKPNHGSNRYCNSKGTSEKDADYGEDDDGRSCFQSDISALTMESQFEDLFG